MPGVAAGKRDRLVTIRRLRDSQSGSGAAVETPEVVTNLYAEKVPDSGTEAFREDQVQGWANVTWRTLWFRDGLDDPTVKWQIVEGARVYDVLSVREIGRRAGWEFVTRVRAEDQIA